MKIIDSQKAKLAQFINSRSIPVGTVFAGQISGYEPGVYLRTYNAVVSLSNPGTTWTDCYPDVSHYHARDAELHLL